MLPSQMLAGLILANQTLASPPLEQSLWLYLLLPHTISNHPSTANHLSPFFLFNPFSFFKMLVCGENSADFNQYHPRVFLLSESTTCTLRTPTRTPQTPASQWGGNLPRAREPTRGTAGQREDTDYIVSLRTAFPEDWSAETPPAGVEEEEGGAG